MPVTRNNRRVNQYPEQEFTITLKVRLGDEDDRGITRLEEGDIAAMLDYGLDQGVYRDDRNATFIAFDRDYDYVVAERVKPIEVG